MTPATTDGDAFAHALAAERLHNARRLAWLRLVGVAGFFGMPVEYAPLAADGARPHLPGLLAPKYRVTDTGVPEAVEVKRTARLHAAHAWKAFKSGSLSSFAFVDSMGLFFAASLLGDSFSRGSHRADHHERAGLSEIEDQARVPRITSRVDGTPLSVEERCALALTRQHKLELAIAGVAARRDVKPRANKWNVHHLDE